MMATHWHRVAPVLVSVVLLGALSQSSGIRAFTLNGPSWAASSVPYLLNPANLDLSANAVEATIQSGAAVWANQTNASFDFSYAGRSAQTTITNDAVNLVIFRNASSGSTIATTYYWYNSSGLLDADIVFWDAGFDFFSGSSGCSGGFYIEDVAAHEFGHALGLGHTNVSGATMYPSISYCSTGPRSLHADDIAGVEALYPPSSPPPLPSIPTGFRIVTTP
jgi:hypothetical protein